MLDKVTFQAYKWELEPVINSDDCTIIYIHGLTADNKRVTIKIPDFKPYVYLELDQKIKWTESKLELLRTYLKKSLNSNYPVNNKFVERKKNYFYKKAKFLWLSFRNIFGIRHLEKIVKNPINLFGVGKIKLQLHEQKAPPILQLFAMRKIKPSGWITATKTSKTSLIEEHGDIFSSSDIELVSGYGDIKTADGVSGATNPKIVSYDIECISGDKTGNTFPNPSRKTDQIICICATVANYQDKEEVWKTYALVNEVDGKICPDIPENATVLHFPSERELLLGWTAFINDINPDIITGYNTLTFDDWFMSERANLRLCWPRFANLGRIIGRQSQMKEIKWSSSAYGDQKFNYVDISGRLHMDMYPIIFKQFSNLASYSLDFVSESFLGDHKIDLSAKEMIQSWHRGEEEDIRNIVVYCCKDTLLPLKLMKHLNSWLDLIEMSNVVMVPVFDLVTGGQQKRVYSQVYCLAYDLGVVCTDRWADYQPSDADKEFVGATVQNPRTGYWKLIPTYDFMSLYPTTIIAYNICFSTFVLPDENPPPDQYHDLVWEDHVGCAHDTAVRKTKIKKKICKTHHYRFYKAHIKKGIIPMLLENLLAARAAAKAEIKNLSKKLKEYDAEMTDEEKEKLLLDITILDKRQNGLKVSANSMYGGFGSDFSYCPFYPAAASTTAMGRKSIQQAIDYAKAFRPDTIVVYGDTDSCMLHFSNIRNLKECFQVAEKLEHEINSIFPKPMYLELEKIYGDFYLLSKKRYIGRIVNPDGSVKATDKKGVVIKRRDNCGYLREVYAELIKMIMNEDPRWKIYNYLCIKINDLLFGRVNVEQLVITKSIKDNYKAKNLPHVAVADKMRQRGKYVVTGTRIRYVFVETAGRNDPQYVKAEDPDYYMQNTDTVKLDYMYYFEKQLVKPIDEALSVRFGISCVLQNLFRLIKKGVIDNANSYFRPKFIVK